VEINLPHDIEIRVKKTAKELGMTPSQLIVERLLPALGLEGQPLGPEEVWGKGEKEEEEEE
jgi:hypothetical protein